MKKNRFWIIVGSIAILAVILACTLPISIVIPSEEQKTDPLPPTAVPPTAVPPITIPPTAIPPTAVPPTTVPPTAISPTATINVAPVDWSGVWTIWMGANLQQLNFDLVLNQSQLSGNAAIGGGNSIGFYGLISPDKRTVTGNWESTDGRNGTFTWRILDNYVQFNGNKSGSEQICGSRTVTTRPAACLAQ
jgi:hypothetical protein